MDLNELLENVNSKQSFFQFIRALKEDKIDEEEKEKVNPSPPYGSGVNGWENGSISAFLDAIERFGKGNELIKDEPDWYSFALLFYAGKFYE